MQCSWLQAVAFDGSLSCCVLGMTLQNRLFEIYNSEIIQKMSDDNTQFFVGESTELEGASLAIKGTAQIDGKFSGKVTVKHLVVGKNCG